MTAQPLERDPYVTAFWILAGDVDQKDLEEILREGCALLQPANAGANDEVFQTIESRFNHVAAEHTRRRLQLLTSDVSQHVGS